MENQQYANHRKLDPLYHFVLSLLTLVVLVGTVIHFIRTALSGGDVFPALLLFLIGIAMTLIFLRLRSYPLKAQDRAIRAEEQLRHYILTGQRLDPRLSVKQIIALRFAGDEEFAELCRKAAEQNLQPEAIKKAIGSWRPDQHRL